MTKKHAPRVWLITTQVKKAVINGEEETYRTSASLFMIGDGRFQTEYLSLEEHEELLQVAVAEARSKTWEAAAKLAEYGVDNGFGPRIIASTLREASGRGD